MATVSEWVYVAVGVGTMLSLVAAGLRFLVKGWLAELRPNHGSSLHDRVTRIEGRVDAIYDHLITGGRS